MLFGDVNHLFDHRRSAHATDAGTQTHDFDAPNVVDREPSFVDDDIVEITRVDKGTTQPLLQRLLLATVPTQSTLPTPTFLPVISVNAHEETVEEENEAEEATTNPPCVVCGDTTRGKLMGLHICRS